MDDLIYRQDAINLLKKWSGGYDYIDTETESAIKDFQHLPSAQQWIPCSERLPNDDGNYIVTLSYTEGFKFSFVDIDNFSVYEHRWDTYGSDVVAWMSLPQSWEGE